MERIPGHPLASSGMMGSYGTKKGGKKRKGGSKKR